LVLGSKVQVSQVAQICSEQKFSSLVDVRKIITPRTFIVSGYINNRWKDEKLVYIFHV
jgi:hypothetical protein